MTVQQMFNSLPILQRVMELKMPLNYAYAIYNLAKQINDKRDFFIKEERKLIEQFQAEILENGNIRFKTLEEQEQFSLEHANLMQCELDDLKCIEIPLECLKDASFTPMELLSLEGAINFIE